LQKPDSKKPGILFQAIVDFIGNNNITALKGIKTANVDNPI
jgi:hypothetical protein